MGKKWIIAVAVVHAAVAVWAAGADKEATTKSAQATATTTTAPATEELKYIPATKEQIAANHARAKAWAETTQKTIVPSMHLVETKHFLIYSAWRTSDDKALSVICEKMYVAMCKQFDVPADQNIWAGKCPIFLFWEEGHYRRFTTEVDKVGLAEASGYNYNDSSGFTYIVMNHVKPPRASNAWAKTRFFEVMVHEASHAFLGRYLTPKSIPSWINEGLADYMAATLVPTSGANRKYKTAAREAITKNRDVSGIFKTVKLESFDYGIAQSLVRFMIGDFLPQGGKYKDARIKSREAFIKIVTLMKKGATEADALKQAYDVDREQLLKSWYRTQAAIYGQGN